MDAREEVSSGLFVAGCDGAKVLDDVEETFDEVALAIERKVALARRLAICPRRNDGLDAADFEMLDEAVAIIAFVGEEGCGFVVLKAGVNRPHQEIEKEVVKLVRDKIGPVAAFKMAVVVSRLPKTRSGKILRGTMKKIADHDAWALPATIEDPKALDEIAAALGARAR